MGSGTESASSGWTMLKCGQQTDTSPAAGLNEDALVKIFSH